MKKLFAVVLSTILVGGIVVTAVAATITVHPGNMQGWGFLQETATGSGQLVLGPGTPPSGVGSAQLIVNNTGGEIIGKLGYAGVKLSSLSRLQYSTYRATGNPALAIALQFNIDHDSTDANTGFQGRLVYEPYHTQTVSTGVWQTWDALNDAAGTGTGNWWFTGAPGASLCPMSNPCTWMEVNGHFPNAQIHPSPTLGAVVLKAGGGWTGGFNGNVDALTIGVAGVNDTYDFEPFVVATNKDQCKDGGWQSLRRADGSSFKNQGDCVQYTNTGR